MNTHKSAGSTSPTPGVDHANSVAAPTQSPPLQQNPNPGANRGSTTITANKPSDDNQRHSNKVQAIEVLINSVGDFMPQLAVGDQGVGSGKELHGVVSKDVSPPDMGDEQMQHAEETAREIQYVPNLSEVSIPTMQEVQHAHHYPIGPGANVAAFHMEPGATNLDVEYDHLLSSHHGAPPNFSEHDPVDHHQNVVQQQQHSHHGVVDDGALVERSAFDIDAEVQSPQHHDPNGLFDDSPGVAGQVVSDNAVMGGDSGQNDKRFYTLVELAEMEPMFERKFYADGNAHHSAHVLLSPQEYRAKLYWLDQENRWKDIGTGRFRLLLSKDNEEHYIQVVSEDCMDEQMSLGDDLDKVVDDLVPNQQESNSGAQGLQGGANGNAPKQVFLHRCFVQCLQEFSRQGDTIITWQDDYKNEFALSFQDEKGAQNTWWSICFLKGIQINSNIDEPNEPGNTSETNSINGSGVVLPTKENLAELVNELYSQDAYTRRNIAEAVLKQEENLHRNNGNNNNNGASSEMSDRDHSKLQTWRSQYLDKLQKIFIEVEGTYRKATRAMEENEGDEHDRCIHITQQVGYLHSLFQIFRNLLNLNQSELLEVLLNENYWMTTFGALEYDPEVFSPMGYKYDTNGGARSPVGVGQPKMSSGTSLVSSPNSAARSYGNYDHFEQANQYNQCLAQEADFREFLSNKVKFKQAVTISDPQVMYSIHLSYKLQYLKDTAMARFIDENTSHTIMQLVSSLHQIILDYIFGDDFERIQAELIQKMRDNSNVEDKENALKFFLEICTLLKSINLTNRQLQTCNNAFTKIMLVLAQIFDIMLPDRKTLLAEVKGDKEMLIKIFEQRNLKDLERAAQDRTATAQAKEGSEEIQAASQTDNQEGQQNAREPIAEEEKEDSIANAPVTPEKPSDSGPQREAEYGAPQTPDAHNNIIDKRDQIINPGRETVEEYLKNPLHSEDPKMTQIDILKSNSIEIFYSLLVLLNNVNHSTIRDFLCSEHQKKQNYVFLRHLAQHMMYSSQQGIKVSICEFFKDLTSKETSEMQKNFQQTILSQVVAHFVDFLSEEDSAEDVMNGESGRKPDTSDGKNEDHEMKDEELKSQESRQTVEPKVQAGFRKQIDQSRILILQFLNKLIVDNVDQYQLRHFFINNKVLLKVADCARFKSIQTNVEVIKFFKAIVQAKDTMSVNFMIKKQIFETILDILLNNQKKGNLLHSCILNLFEMLTPAEVQPNSASGNSILVMGLDNGYGAPKTEGGYVQLNLLNKLYQRLNDNGYVKRVFLNKKYEDGFRKFNRHLRQVLDLHMSEQDSKQASDRDRSNSQSQHKQASSTNLVNNSNQPWALGGDQTSNNREGHFKQSNAQGYGNGQQQYPVDYEDELVRVCFNNNEAGENATNAQVQSLQEIEDGSGEKKDSAEGEPYDFFGAKNNSKNGNQQQQEHDSPADQQEGIEASNLVDLGSEERKDSAVKGYGSGSPVQVKHNAAAADGATDVQMMGSGAGTNQANDQEELQLEGKEQMGAKQFLALPKTDAATIFKAVRPARSMSPMSGHAELGSSVQAQNSETSSMLKQKSAQGPDALINSLAAQWSSESPKRIVTSPSRLRRLSQDENQQMNDGMARQGSSNSLKPILSVSDEGNESNKAANKSAFSETISNPDLDEIFFNKQTSSHPTGLSFQIGPPNTLGGNLKIQRQSSPLQDGNEPNSPGVPPMPFRKSSTQKKKLRQKIERSRRAFSSEPFQRSADLSQHGQDPDALKEEKEAAAEQDKNALSMLLDAKLSGTKTHEDGQELEVKNKRRSLEMCRTESISDINLVIGEKRLRRDSDGLEDEGEDSNGATGGVKDKWISKRPKLAAAEDADVKISTIEAAKAQEDISKMLDASFGAAQTTKPETGN